MEESLSSAEGAIHSLGHEFYYLVRLKRAFSACLHDNSNSWGDAPGLKCLSAFGAKQKGVKLAIVERLSD